MKYHELEVSKNKTSTRKGRGISAGQGKTAGRGTKGQNSRSGAKKRRSFEGGQTPLLQRLPKLRGFTSHRRAVETVTTGQLEKLTEATIDNQVLSKYGIVPHADSLAKVVLKGEMKTAKQVNLQFVSAGGLSAIESAGGKFTKTQVVPKKSKEVIAKEVETK
jgi:large subunit ribosomal protein L15